MCDTATDEDNAPDHDIGTHHTADHCGEQGGDEGILKELIREDALHPYLCRLSLPESCTLRGMTPDDSVVVTLLYDDQIELGAKGLGELNPS